MKKVDRAILSTATAFTTLYSVLDELSNSENTLIAGRASDMKKYMAMSCLYLDDKQKLLSSIECDLHYKQYE